MPNCHPKIHRKNFAAWCEDCKEVFGDQDLADEHEESLNHKVKVLEYLVSEPIYSAYAMSAKEMGKAETKQADEEK
jgi:hypothetical protein